MKYCANLRCPHRERVGTPAEFLDRVARCSDCGTKLVDSEEDAAAGRAPANDPYRAPGAVHAPAGHEQTVRGTDAGHWMAFLLGGVVLTTVGFAFAERAHGVWALAVLPLAYFGLFLGRARARRE